MFITRDKSGNVQGVYACEQYAGQEFREGAELWSDPAMVKKAAALKSVSNDNLLKLIASGDKAQAAVLVAELESAKVEAKQ